MLRFLAGFFFLPQSIHVGSVFYWFLLFILTCCFAALLFSNIRLHLRLTECDLRGCVWGVWNCGVTVCVLLLFCPRIAICLPLLKPQHSQTRSESWVYLHFTLVLFRAHALEIRTNDSLNQRNWKRLLFSLVTFEVLSPYANVYFLLITVSVYAY